MLDQSEKLSRPWLRIERNHMTTTSLEIAPERTELLTMKEASQRLRISRSTLYDLMHRQRLETVKIGRRRLVPPEALANLIMALREESM